MIYCDLRNQGLYIRGPVVCVPLNNHMPKCVHEENTLPAFQVTVFFADMSKFSLKNHSS